MGLAGVKASWQRQTLYFGHERGDRYSVLVLDNRGIGASDKPLGRYSTSEMARDVLDVLDHVGWTAARSVNVVGISLGGMVAQELACAAPRRLQSLTLLCTTAHARSGQTLAQTLAERAALLRPKPLAAGLVDTARRLFADEWLARPDDEACLPAPGATPRCGPAPGGGAYGRFASNFQRFQAQELAKRRVDGAFTLRGFLCQLVAAGWHDKSDEQLRRMGDAVGRARIMVVHGTADRMLAVDNGRALAAALQPGTALIVDGMGHAPIMDRAPWFNALLEERLAAWAALDDAAS